MNAEQRAERNKRVVALAKQGLTLQEIGNRVGLKKNTVHSILSGAVKPLSIRQRVKKSQNDSKWLQKTGYTREEFKALDKEVYETCRRMLASSKQRAKEKNIEHTLRLKDVVELYGEGRCAVTGEMLERGGETRDNSPSLDRVDNEKGYVKDNVVVMSWRLNRIKHNANVRELELLVQFLLQRGGN